MSNTEESDDAIKSKHEELCLQLNIDLSTSKKSWESYTTIKKNFSLDGDPLHWVSCALYVACRSSFIPTVKSGKAVEGNCVSLTKLLRLCKISLIQFFNKIKKWMEMASMSEEFRIRIERLERKFAVSTVLFQKYQPLFLELFQGLSKDTIKPPSKGSKKQRLLPCSTNALYEFTWCLFVCVKGEFHSSADDLVDMYHVLLSCLDFVYGNAVMAHRNDLLNPNFPGIPKDWNSDNYLPPKEPPCIISHLCKTKDSSPVEASTTKQYSWRPVILDFFSKKFLKGDEENFIGVLDVGNFDHNLKSLNNLYEMYVLSVGEFDERIFLGEHGNTDLGTPNKISGEDLSKTIANFGVSGRPSAPDTPLTGRRYLRGLAEPMTPVSAATHSVARLRSYLSGCKPQPSSNLLALFNECGVCEESVRVLVREPCARWAARLEAALRGVAASEEAGRARAAMATALHYKVLEQVVRDERRKKPHVHLQTLLGQEIFQLTQYACCAEIVLHAYGTHSARFPWLLGVYSLSAFHFYKIIEPVVQAVMDKLSRDVVKHLNAVEEQALESLVWASGSPLWERLGAVPASVDVSGGAPPSPTSPLPSSHVAVRRLTNGLQSPISSVSDRFLTPVSDMARKQLFRDPIKPGQSLLMPTSTGGVIMTNTAASTPSQDSQPDSQEQTDNAVASQPRPDQNGQATSESDPPSNESTPRKGRGGSLHLFFRKFYSLCVVRMNDLCMRLRLTDAELKRKIWTCMEYSIVNQTHLMRDRHLDQILMCAVYVICKVSNNANNRVERTFTDIMRHYRQQPQADNHVYRSVLITNEDGTTERGDLIKFYNKVYVQCMQSFALQFAGRQRAEECSLSPLPCGRGESGSWSPGGGGGGGGAGAGGQRVSDRHRLYVKPLTTPPPAAPQLTYRFSRSPAKDLRAINTMVCVEAARGVKRERDGSAGATGPATATAGGVVKRANAPHAVARKLHHLVTDRQQV